MKRLLSLVFSAVVILGLLSGCGGKEDKVGGNEAAAFSVGYGQVDITPAGNVALTGFGDADERLSTRVTEPLYATCIAVKDAAGDTVLIVAYDLINCAEAWSIPTRQAVSEATGVPYDHVMLHSSHTHSGPDIAKMPPYQNEVKAKTVEAAQAAMADLAPATMSGSYTRVEEKVSCVRHYLLIDGTYMGEGVGAVPKNELVGHTRMPDNLLQMVKFEREDKKDIVMMNWQAHYLGSKLDYYAITSDYPGVARATIEKALNCQSIFILGASGNLNSWSQFTEELDVTYHTELGQLLGEKIIAMDTQLTPLRADDVQVKYVSRPTPTKNDPAITEEVPLYAVSFGDMGMFFAPYEMFDISAIQVRERSPFTMTFCASCSNAARSYIPTPECWDWEQKYEVRITRYAKGTAEALVDEFVAMLTELSANGPAPAAKGDGYFTPEFVPFTDGVTYTNPAPGQLDACAEVANGFYQLMLMDGRMNTKIMLAKDRATAEAVLAQETVKLMFNEQNVIVGIAP